MTRTRDAVVTGSIESVPSVHARRQDQHHEEQGAMSQTIQARAEQLKAFVRQHQAGGCRMLSEGNACACPLCAVDSLLTEITRLQQPIPPESEISISGAEDNRSAVEPQAAPGRRQQE